MNISVFFFGMTAGVFDYICRMNRKTSIIVSISGFILFVISTIIMWQRYQAEALWGHWPLILFLSFWVGIAGLRFQRRQNKTPQHTRWMAYSVLSALLLSIGFPPLAFTILLFVGFVPLLLIEKEVSESSEGHNRKLVFRYAYNTFLLWNIMTTFWVTNTALIAGLLAISANSFLMCIPFILYHHSRHVISQNLQGLGFIVFWITFEYLHHQWQLSWPWLTLGNGLSEFPALIQWYEYTGAFGGSLWVLWFNLLAFRIVSEARQKELKSYINPVLVLFIPIAFSIYLFTTYTPQGNPVEVVVVQPNFEPHYEKFTISRSQQLQRFLKLSDSLVTDKTKYVLFPETSFNRVDTSNVLKNSAIKSLKKYVDQHPGLKIVTGISSYKLYEADEPHSPATRTGTRRSGEPYYWESYNAAYQISSETDQIPIYLKSIHVPGAESFPYRKYLFFMKPVVDALDGAVALGKQEERAVFSSKEGNVAPIICYESIYGRYVTDYIKKGANALFIGTNDGWWDHTAGHKQHLQFATLRAIETRRSIARSANTGISAFIDQRGQIHQATDYGAATAIRGDLLFNDQITIYTVWGDLVARISLFTSILLLLNSFVRGITGKRN